MCLHRLLDSGLDRYRLRLFGWCFDDCHAFLLFLPCSFVLRAVLQLRCCSLSARPKHGLRFPEQPEAGVTPEARRDRAAILRHRGVAPAHPSVLAAFPFLPWPYASAHFSIGLSTPAAKADPNDPPNVPSWLFFTSPAVLGVGFRFGVRSNKPICPSTSSVSKITLRCGARS